MASEISFRTAAAVIILAAATTSAYHRIQAAKSGERISRRDEGRVLFWMIRIGALPLFISTALYLFRPAWISWASLPVPDVIRWFGVGIGGATVLLLLWTLRSLGKNLTDTVVTRQRHTLVTHGPYRWIRHPFYVCLLLLSVALGLVAANWFIAASGVYVFVMLAIRVKIEERKLAERFGDSYRDYQRSTGRFLPRIIQPGPR